MPCDEGHRKAVYGKPYARFDEGGQAILLLCQAIQAPLGERGGNR